MARRYNPEEEELQISDGRHYVDEDEFNEDEEEETVVNPENEDDDPEPEYEDYGDPYADEEED